MRIFSTSLVLACITLFLNSCQDPNIGIPDLNSRQSKALQVVDPTKALLAGKSLNLKIVPESELDIFKKVEYFIESTDGKVQGPFSRVLTQTSTSDKELFIDEVVSLSPGRYELSWKLFRADDTHIRGKLVFFIYDPDVGIRSVKILPLSVESSAKAMAIVDLGDNLEPDMMVRWSLGGRVIGFGPISDGGRILIFDTPRNPGTYFLSTEIFPSEAMGYILESDTAGVSNRTPIVAGESPSTSTKMSYLAPRGLYDSLYLLDGSLRSWSFLPGEGLKSSDGDIWAAYGSFLGTSLGRGRAFDLPKPVMEQDGRFVDQMWSLLVHSPNGLLPKEAIFLTIRDHSGDDVLKVLSDSEGFPILLLQGTGEPGLVGETFKNQDAKLPGPVLLDIAIRKTENSNEVFVFIDGVLLIQKRILQSPEGVVKTESDDDEDSFSVTVGNGGDPYGVLALGHTVGSHKLFKTEEALLGEKLGPEYAFQPLKQDDSVVLPISQGENLSFDPSITIEDSVGVQKGDLLFLDNKGNLLLAKPIEKHLLDQARGLPLIGSLNGLSFVLSLGDSEQVIQLNQSPSWAVIKLHGDLADIVSSRHISVKKFINY